MKLKQLRKQMLAMVVATFAVSAAGAAKDASAQDNGHAGHQRAKTTGAKPAVAPAMNHDDMQLQGSSAPPDARDPHAYSGDYTLESGPYVLGSKRQLRLGDEKAFGTVLFDNLEAVRSHGNTSGAYDVLARLGRDYNKLLIKAEGDVDNGKIHEARTEALWSHAVATFWDIQLGVRHDSGVRPDRTWLALGVQGLAPYWVEIDATAYVGDGGHTALRLDAEYELLITQKLIVQPHIEANFFGKSDVERGIGKGVSDLTVGVRVRYEFNRQFAPYVGVEWAGSFGETADLARAAGERTREASYIAGVRFWF